MEHHTGERLQNVGTIPSMSAHRYGDKTALTFMGQETTFDELETRANKIAHTLVDAGVEPGERVGLLIPNEPMFPAAYFGAIKAGAVATPLNLRMDPETLGYVLDDAGANVMLSSAFLSEGTLGWDPMKLADTADLDTVFTPGQSDEERNIVNLSHKLGEAPEEFDIVDRGYDDIAAQPYTSGTTGKPKGVKLSHKNLLTTIESYGKSGLGIDADDKLVLVLPMFHIYALNALLGSFMVRGGTLNLQPRPDIGTVLGALDTENATAFAGVPAIYTEMWRIYRENPEDYDLSELNYVVCAAAPLADDVRRTIEEEWDVPMIEGWGMTETSPAGTIEPVAGVRKEAGCIGPPVPGVDLKLVDPDTRETKVSSDDLYPNPDPDIDFDDEDAVSGEIAIKGPQVFEGYHNLPETTEDVFDDEDWFYTDDIGKVDEDGYFWMVDRADDMIISGGNNIYPAEVEDALYEHPDIAEAAVVAAPHAVKGEAPVAFVVLEEGADITEKEIREFSLDHVASYAHPRRVFFVDELPRSATNKVQRFELENQLETMLEGSLEPTDEEL
jgi:long-chain acyl-CoA synthetase